MISIRLLVLPILPRADRARVFAIARGEVCEACAAVEIAAAIGCANAEDVKAVHALGKRLSDMLGRLVT